MTDTIDAPRHLTLAELWPSLPLADWQATYTGLHLRTQIVGKTRLALAPMENHWWQTALYVTARGLTTSPMPCGAITLAIDLDLIDHALIARTSEGATAALPLRAEPVADFYRAYRTLLSDLGASVKIWPVPQETAVTTPFPQDREHASYDPGAAQRCWRILVQVDRLLKDFRGRFLGKCSPSHFWWGSFDMACTRFSGERAPRHPGGFPHLADFVTREAYSHACISAGWWPGTAGGIEEPAFYAYAYPEPAGCAQAPLRPAAARYDPALHEWILPYEAVRALADPAAAVMEFLESTYEAAANLGGWNRQALERSPDGLAADPAGGDGGARPGA
ncbi:MAG TPA: DUF5996 family protein [Thermoanaerobaculia bacterium]|nr:DUF5996 family protein [Thermoanaerobaculia bacterium]